MPEVASPNSLKRSVPQSQSWKALIRLHQQHTKKLLPPPRLSVAEWADRERVLSPEASAAPGRWHTSAAEYLRGVMEAISDPSVEQVVFVSASQCGKTEALLNVIGYHIQHDPSPLLCVMPTLEMAQAFSKDRLATMLRDTPALMGTVADPRTRDSGNTTLHKTFPGGHVTLAGSNSPANLSSRPVRVVLLDEVSRYPETAGSEGDPVSLAIRRSQNFWNRRIVMVSTPTVKGECRISAAFANSDQRRYHVECPHCEARAPMTWENVKWPDDHPEQAAYHCPACEVLWSEPDRLQAISRGKWIAQGESEGIAGFHLPGLCSPWVPIPQAAQEFCRVKGYPEQLRTWVNTYLAETWEEQGENVDDLGLYARRESWDAVPNEVLVVVAGVDVQDDRLEVTLVGFGESEEAWVLSHEIIYADPSTPACWESLTALLAATHTRADGVRLHCVRACVDSGGHFTQTVYQYCQRSRIAMAIKGQYGSEDDPIIRRPSRQAGRVQLLPITSNKIKALLYFRLQRTTPGPGYVHFHDSLDAEWFEQLTAETMRRTYNRGKLTYLFKARRPRNEALDCMAYAIAALALLNVRDWSTLADKRGRGIAPAPQPAKSARPALPGRGGSWAKNWRV